MILLHVFLILVSSTMSVVLGAVHIKQEWPRNPVVEANLVDEINQINSLSWVATTDSWLNKLTLSEASMLCGVRDDPHAEWKVPVKQFSTYTDILQDIPLSFDAREKWPQCASLIGAVADQGPCGSCWAVATTTAFSDRTCIISNGTYNKPLSWEETTACAGLVWYGSHGCTGGQPAGAWKFFGRNGLVTGGGYELRGTGTTCYPYSLPGCDHAGTGPDMPPCTQLAVTPSCQNACPELAYPIGFVQDQHFAGPVYTALFEEGIQREIMEKGSVVATMAVYSDFLAYKRGVYHHVGGVFVGAHAIKLIGWGVEDNYPYWLGVNSWNKGWGDDGLFKILRGKDECGIEASITAAEAIL